MNKDQALSRQILLFMLSLAFSVITVAVVGSYLFYSFLIDYIPGGMSMTEEDSMNFFDWLWIFMASAISITIAVLLAYKLSARILNPLSSVATSLRRIAQGDLGARAFSAQIHLGEVNNLVNDFNYMAEKLQTLDAARRSWNAAIAHELRTPVTVLKGRLQGLVEGVFEPDPVLFNNLLQQTEGLSRLIGDLRIVGAAEGGEFSLDLKKLSFLDVLGNTTCAFSHEFRHHGFELHTELNDMIIRCDPLRIIQCLTVFFDNAIKYSVPGIITVRNGTSDDTFYIEVEDCGPGIPADFQLHMFEPFQRGSTGRAANPKGCGLGLSVVKAIMHAHGGDVSYTLTKNNGSLFTLRWPV